MKKILFILPALLCFLSIHAQTPDDALRYSQTQIGGTARAVGTGGAFGALGADFTSLSINPAGIGLYRKSEFTITPSLYFTNTESEYWGNTETDNINNFNINNIGLVFKGGGRRPDSDWRAVNFGFGLNRINNYNRKTLLIGTNTKNSLLDYYANQASGTPGNEVRDNFPFGAGLAYFAFLINPDAEGSSDYLGVTNSFAVEQQEYITEKNATEEFVISLGTNYKEKLFLGGTLGIPFVKYTSEKFYSETDKLGIIQGEAVDLGTYDFNTFELSESLKTRGFGINGKLGLIYRPVEMLRVGASVHTPTLISLNEQFSSNLYAEFTHYDTLLYSPEGEYDYQLTTPWRLVGSAAFLFKTHGFISVDYEWADYSQMEFTFDDVPEDRRLASEINRDIDKRFTSASNLRIGSEVALDIFRLRLGYVYQGSPYKDASDLKRQSITAGLGFREKVVFCDVAYAYSFGDNKYYPYSINTESDVPAFLKNKSSNFLLTLGLRF